MYDVACPPTTTWRVRRFYCPGLVLEKQLVHDFLRVNILVEFSVQRKKYGDFYFLKAPSKVDRKEKNLHLYQTMIMDELYFAFI